MLMPISTDYGHHDGRQRHSQPLTTPPPRNDHDQRYQRQHQYQTQYPDQDVSMLDGESDGPKGLDKLLGCDTDAYIEEQMEKYERAVTRWRECSLEEWITGADGKSLVFPFSLSWKRI